MDAAILDRFLKNKLKFRKRGLYNVRLDKTF